MRSRAALFKQTKSRKMELNLLTFDLQASREEPSFNNILTLNMRLLLNTRFAAGVQSTDLH